MTAWSEVRTRVGTILFCKITENAVKITNSQRFTAFTAKRCKKYAVKIIFFFTAFHRISYEISPLNIEPGMRWMHWVFVRNAVIAVKINISPHFTLFLTKIHRKIHRISYKNSTHRPLWQINVRNAVKAANAVKKNNSPHFIAFLTKIHYILFSQCCQCG